MQFVQAERERYSDDGKPPVPWERYLEVTPALVDLDRAAREEALADRNLDTTLWARAETYWLLTFALDLAAGKNDRVDAFGRACASVRTIKGPQAMPAEMAAPEKPPVPRSSSAVAAPPPSAARPATGLRTETTSEAMPVYRPPVLPFGQTPSAERAAPRVSSPAPAPRPASPARPDATVMDMATVRAPALPFASGQPPVKLPDLTLEEHARISAELAIGAAGPARDDILRRHGIDGADMLTRLGVEWQSRMSADPSLATEWRAAYARHRATLQDAQRRR